MRKLLTLDIFLLLGILLLSLFIVLPYFHRGYFPTHDGEWAVVRLADMYREVRDLQIPPRFSGNLNAGYGYPLFNFAYPFPYYLGTFLVLGGLGFITSIKTLFALTVFLSGIWMFFLSKQIWKSAAAGFVSALLYLYLPYRFVDLYVRGSIGESIAFILFPAIFFFAIKIMESKNITKHFIFGVIFYAALILSHNIMALLFTGTITAFFVTMGFLKRINSPLRILSFYLLSYSLSAFFWLPALLEKKLILLSKIPIADRSLYFVTIDRFLFSRWGYGVPTEPDSFTYQLGCPHIIGLVITALYAIFLLKKNKHCTQAYTAIVFVGITLLLFFFLFPFSQIFWQTIPLLSEINYPWILLGLLGFLTSVAIGFLTINKTFQYVALTLSFFAVVLYLPNAKPQNFVQRVDDYYVTNDATTTSSKELMPLWVKTFPLERPKEKAIIVKGNGIISNISYNSKNISFAAALNNPSTIRINTMYYPGWKVETSGKIREISYKNDFGVMDIMLEKGSHVVKAAFGETSSRLFADIVSLCSAVILCLLIFANKKRIVNV